MRMYYLNPTGSGYLIYHYGHSLHHYGFRPVRAAYAFAVGCLDVTHKDAAGSITGFRGLFSYVGAALAGVPVILVKNNWEWSGVYLYAVLAILLTTLSLALLAKFHRL